MIWNSQAECMGQREREAGQVESLRKLAEHVYKNVPFYKNKFDQMGVKPADIQSISDIVKLPFTSKDELRETYPYGLLAVDESELVEIHMSSGTTGTPVLEAYTQKDIDTWSEAMARCLTMAGVGKGDVIQNAYGYGLFTGGLGVHYGARAVGANLIPISGGNTQKQLQVMQDFNSTFLTCTPSYSLFIAEYARENGYDMSKMALRGGAFGAEPWTDDMRKEMEVQLHLKAYDIYGLTEITGPGVANECECQDGLHVQEDFFYPEIINPETGEPVADGEKGELVFTTLLKTGTPLIRYRTRDITTLSRGTCSCGRTTVKMHRLMGRTDDMLIIRGVNVFPTQIEEILVQLEETEPHYQIVVDRGQTHLDEIEVWVEIKEKFFFDETKGMEHLRTKIKGEMKSRLGINPIIKLVEPKTIERSIGKAKRVIDKRNL
ncbi:MAG: phenylacetate--CoA ligase [Spirochaetales bacterium]|nr:phenylacetate--CoA ligase [Spirochaetales bacterium]